MLRRPLLFVAAIGIATVLVAADADTVSRAFELKHASVLEVSAAVQPLLSQSGSITVQPKLSRIVVQDRSDIVRRVATLIEELDHLPGLYSIEVELLEGTEPKPYGTQDEVEANVRLRKMFNVAAFRRLGKSTVEGQLGNRAQVDLGTDFRVAFFPNSPKSSDAVPWGTPDQDDRINLRPLVLERLEFSSDGQLTPRELLRTSVVLAQKQTVYIGAGNSEDTDHVLVLIVHAIETGSR